MIVLRHALPNALNPVITAISGWFAALLAGAFFVENVFAFQGLGSLTVNALLNIDLPVVLGSVIVTALFFILVNLLADILYRIANPTISP
jgi:peptide/nickel transport system permease protein